MSDLGPAVTVRLRGILRKHDVTVEELAKSIGSTRALVLKWFYYPHRFPRERVKDIESFLHDRGMPTNGIWQLVTEATRSKRRQAYSELYLNRPEAEAEVDNLTQRKAGLRLVVNNSEVVKAKVPIKVDVPEVLTQKQELLMNTKEFLTQSELKNFKLKRDPFDDIMDPSNIWRGEQQKGIESLMWRTTLTHSILAVDGEAGSGKSTIVRSFLKRAQQEGSIITLSPASLDRQKLSEGSLVTAICRGLAPDIGIPTSMENRSEQVRRLLTDAFHGGQYPVLIIEEAHALPTSAFIALKRLWDSFDLYKMLGIIMVGLGGSLVTGGLGSNAAHGLDLGRRLKLPELRELGQRTRVAHLHPLNKDDIRSYFEWRCQNVGSKAEQLFSASAYNALARKRQMAHPLALNNIAVLAIRSAKRQGDDLVEADHINHALK